jgi:hypothetical protein
MINIRRHADWDDDDPDAPFASPATGPPHGAQRGGGPWRGVCSEAAPTAALAKSPGASAMRDAGRPASLARTIVLSFVKMPAADITGLCRNRVPER